MSTVQLPWARTSPRAERLAWRRSPATTRFRAALQLVGRQTAAAHYCAACAAPIDFGAVWSGDDAYCSDECCLGSERPA